MVSPPDQRTGFRYTQGHLHAGSTRLTLELTFTNISRRPVRWSIWDVAQLRRAAHGWRRAGARNRMHYHDTAQPRSRFPDGFNIMFGEKGNPQWGVDLERGLFTGRYRWEIGKVGIDSPGAGSLSATAQPWIRLHRAFTVFPDGEYPDGGPVECWTVGGQGRQP
jgi:hypothetical protein